MYMHALGIAIRSHNQPPIHSLCNNKIIYRTHDQIESVSEVIQVMGAWGSLFAVGMSNVFILILVIICIVILTLHGI